MTDVMSARLMMRRGTGVTQGSEAIHEPWPGQDPPDGNKGTASLSGLSFPMCVSAEFAVGRGGFQQEMRTCGR